MSSLKKLSILLFVFSLIVVTYFGCSPTPETQSNAQDSQGAQQNNQSSNTNYNINDLQTPELSIILPRNGDIVGSNFALIIAAGDDTGVKEILVSVDNGAFEKYLSSELPKVLQVLQTNISLSSAGSHTIKALAKDTVGKSSSTNQVAITVDLTYPVVTITSPTYGQIFNISNITLSGNFSAPLGLNSIIVSVNGGLQNQVNPSGNSFSTNLNLPEGTNVINVIVKDSNNREAQALVEVIVDVTSPAISINYPLNGSIVDNGNIVIQGTSSDNLGIDKVFVKLNDGNFVEANGTTSWNISLYTSEGTNHLYAYSVDIAGNSSVTNYVWFYKTNSGSGGGSTGQFPGDDLNNDPRDWRIYFVMTDRFVDGYSGNNNIYGDEYRAPNNSSDEALRYYNGGDFKGLIDNLDYIKSMGFNAIWITPVVKQPPGRYVNSGQTYDAAGYHGYWGYDFDSIDPHLESPGATFSNLIAEAHARGIKVILDIVVNHGHGGDAHPSVQWYNDRLKVKLDGQWWTYGQATDPYYNNTNGVSDIWENAPGFFTYGGGYTLLDLLDFNERDPRTRQHLINVYKKFIDMGVDGFRIDTVAYMRKQWWGIFADAIWDYAASKGKPWFLQVGEAWVATRSDALDYSKYSSRKAFSLLDLHGSCMDFPGQAKSVFAGSSGFEQMANIMSSDNSGGIDPTFLGTFVDNHDKPRFPGGYADDGTKVKIWKNALNWYFLARGIPIVYYGTELDGTQDHINDHGQGEPFNRMFIGQSKINNVRNNPDNYPIYRHLQLLNTIRENEISIRRGSQINIHLSGNIAVFKREYITSVSYVFLNKGDSSANYNINLPSGNYIQVTPSGPNTLSTNTLSGGSVNVSIPANSFTIIVYKYPAPANSVSVIGDYTVSMSNVTGNLWRTTLNISTAGNVNIKISASYSNGNKTFGDTNEVGTFLPVSGTGEETTDSITFEAPVSGPYRIEFNDATLTYTITYIGNVPITTIIVRSFVGGNNWVGVCGSYSPVTSYNDPANHVPGMAWWGNDPATPMQFKGVDSNNRNIWVWMSTNVPTGKTIEFKPRRNGSDWYPGGNLSVSGGQSKDVTYDWGLSSNEGIPDMTDNTPPTVTITYPTNNQVVVNQTNITMTGTASDNKSGVKNVYISIDNGPFIQASGTTSWSYNYNFSYGSHNIRVFAEDVSNNISTTNSINFTITNIPAIPVKVYYYRPDWSQVNIHYNAGSGWTTPPGVPMTKINSSWWSNTIYVTASEYILTFNNNAGTWDNNNGSDYHISSNITSVGISNRQILTNFNP